MLVSFEIFDSVLEDLNLLAQPSTRQAFISESEEKLSVDYIEFLNDNTRNEAPGNENWTRVYEIAHQIITLDTERLNAEKRADSKKKLPENAIKFLDRVVKLSVPLLKTARLVKNICKVVQNAKYKRIRPTYITTVLQAVIKNENHLENIKLTEWQSLLEKCMDAYQEEDIDYYKVDFIYAVQSIVKFGCLHKKLNIDVVKQLPFLSKLLNKFRGCQIKMKKALIHLTLTVCQSLILEYRMELCKFGEIIMPHLIGTGYLKNEDGDIYDLFLILVRAHHPVATHSYQDASHTFDETKWKRILNEMQAELFEECKHQGPDSLIKLACEVFTITSNGFDQLDSPDFIPTAMNNLQMFTSLSIELAQQQDSYLMISVLISILERYPACLRHADFLPILEIITSTLQLSYNPDSFSYYVNLAVILMDLERSFFKDVPSDESALLWNQIWDEWPKLSIEINKMPDHDKIEYYELLHKFISYSNLYDPSKFCTLYQAEIVKWSPLTVSALLLFCQHFPLGSIKQLTATKQLDLFNINWELTNWSLFIPWDELDDKFPLRDLSELLICLTLQHFCQRPAADPVLLETMLKVHETEVDEDVVKMYISLLTAYKIEDNKQVGVKSIASEKHKLLFDTKNLKQLDDLISHVSKLTAEKKGELRNRILKTALAVRIASDLIDLDAVEDVRLSGLLHNIQASLKIIIGEITNQRLNNQSSIETCVKELKLLFEAASSTIVSEFVLRQMSDDMMFRTIRRILSSEMSPKCDHVKAKLTISLTESAFCCLRTANDVCTTTQTTIMKDVLNADRYDLDKDFSVIVAICEYLIEKGKHLGSEMFLRLIILCKNLFTSRFTNITAVDWLLKFIPALFVQMKTTEQNKFIIMELVFMINEKIEANQYGLETQLKFAKMLCRIVRLEPNALASFRDQFQAGGRALEFEDIVLEQFKCHYFCIRMQMANLLPAVFGCDEMSYEWKVAFFGKIKSIVLYLLNASNKLNSIERIPWIASASNIIIKPIVYANVFANEAAFILLSLQVEKNVSEQMIIKMLNAASKENDCRLMIENRLQYLIAEWLKKFNKQTPAECINKFPHSVLECSSDADFFKQYMKDIFSVIVTSCSLETSVKFCQSLNVTFAQSLKSCFIDILPWLIMHRTVNQAAMEIFTNALGADINNSLRKDLMTNASRVVLTITDKLHDADDFEAIFRIKMNSTKKDSFEFNVGEWRNCLVQLLNSVFKVDEKLDEFFILKAPTELVKIFTGLTKRIYSSDYSYIEERLKYLYQYVSFSYLISTDIAQSKFDSMSSFIIQTTCFDLINMFELEDLVLAECANRYLDLFLRRTASKQPRIIAEIYQHLVNCLTRLALRQTANTDALDTLRYLVINQEQHFHRHISKLVSFPSDEKFRELQDVRNRCRGVTSLEHELTVFLENSNSIFYRDSEENIRHLKDQIKSKRHELSILQGSNIQSNVITFAQPSLIEKVVTRIIQMLKSSSSSEFQLCCVECLGVIGPVKFATRSVYTSDGATRSNGFLSLIYNTLGHLSQCLSCTNFELRESVNNALNSICSSVWSMAIFKDNLLSSLEDNFNTLQFKLPKDYLYPFWNIQVEPVDTVLNIVKLMQVFSPENHTWTTDHKNAPTNWIVDLTCQVAMCVNHFEDMSYVFRSDINFCMRILPELIHSLINSNKNLLSPICLGINKFLTHHFGEECTWNCHPQVAELILNCVDLIKLNVPSTEKCPLDLFAVSRAAMNTSCHIRGLYYAEWAYNEFLIDHWTGRTYKLRELDLVDNENGTKLQLLIRNHCIKIGDIDLVHGCRLMFDDGAKSLKKYYADLRSWDKLIPLQDVNLEDNMESIQEIVCHLQHNGLDWMAQSVASQWNDTTEDWQCQLAWRLADWSTLDQYQSQQVELKPSFEMNHLNALRYFSLNSHQEMKACLKQSRNMICQDIRQQSIDNSQAICAKLSQLQMCREMEELMEARQSGNNYAPVIRDWKLFDTTKGCDFQHLRYILLQRRLLCNLLDTDKYTALKDEIYNTYIISSNIAREQGFLNIAVQELDIAAMNCDVPRQQNYIMQFEQALAVAARAETELAVQKFRNLTLQQDIDPNLKAKALIAYSDKVTELRSQNPLDTSAIYSEAYEILKSQESYDSMMKTQITIAKYKDSLYQDLLEYTSSPEYVAFKNNVESTKPQVKVKNIKDNDMRKTVHILSKQYEDECNVIKSREHNLNEYMLSALNNYLDVLQRTDSYDTYMARVIAIWLKHKNNCDVNKMMQRRLPSIPSFKFVSLMRQISPTLRQDNSLFSQNIRDLIRRMTLEHPYHCIPILLMLKNYQLDSMHFHDDDESLIVATKSKVEAAEELIRALKETKIKQIIDETDFIANALIQIAYTFVPKGARQQEIEKGGAILKVANFHKAAVITMTVQLRKDANYNQGIVGVQKYLSTFKLAGGINHPKVLTCIGTDGKKREQLVKGKDDMRQDAIMQQLFRTVNNILMSNPETQERKLYLRTYNIVPLTQRSGVVEWCQHTKPMIAILLGPDNKSGVHKKYFPNDESSLNCKQWMRNVSKCSIEEKLRVYNKCCTAIHPAFQYFFLENFSSPQLWFERRLTFTKSVAASSIVGYIVGLGDRHFNNILLDEQTCEVIHIDFGIAFEQGSVLSVPETVPFRMTRDIEAGMGPLAVDGVLKRSCQVTLEALRNEHDIIIMLLRVLLYDPLFQWLITEEYTIQNPETSFSSWKAISEYNASNQSAQRALARVQQRLQGLHEGTILTVSVQVTKLIQEARDPTNLCQLFDGWQPFL